MESTRNADDDVELLTAAFSSRFHWLSVGAIEQWITSDWMVARAAAATGDGELSLRFAERAHRAAQENAVPDWLVASTAEGVARAYAVTASWDAVFEGVYAAYARVFPAAEQSAAAD